MQLIMNGKVIWENPPGIGHFAIKLRKQAYEYELVDQLITRAKNQFLGLIQRRCERMEEQKIGIEAEGWSSVADRDREVEALERALATATAELEDARRDFLEKTRQLGECQQHALERERRIELLEAKIEVWQARAEAQKSMASLLARSLRR